METGNYKIRFFTPAYREETSGEAFGACSLGMAFEEKFIEPVTPVCAEFFTDLEGYLLCGRLETVRNELATLGEKADQIKAGIILFGNCGGEDKFVELVRKTLKGVPLAGGSAAVGAEGITGRLLPKRDQVSMLLITDDRYEIRVQSQNIHQKILAEATAITSTPRKIDEVLLKDGTKLPCTEFVRQLAREYGISAAICEWISVCTPAGYNIHMILKDGTCFCGADLPPDGRIFFKYSEREETVQSIREFYSCDHSVVFGCAGLKALLEGEKVTAGHNSLGLFMCGEIASMEGGDASFSNLMLSRITFIKKRG